MTTNEVQEETLQDPRAEAALMGAAAYYPDAIAAVLAGLDGADFYDLIRGKVWDACRKMSAAHEPITPVTVAQHMAANGDWSQRAQSIVQVEMNEPHPARYAQGHAATIADLARRRVLLRTVKRMRSIVTDPARDSSEAHAAARDVFDELGRDDDRRLGGTLTWTQMLDEFEAAHHPDATRDCIPTPWPEVDEYLDGLFGGRMYVIGGAPGDGKSATALNIAWNAAQLGHGVLVFSKEMPTIDVTGRLVARGAEINLAAINGRRLDDLQRARYRDLRRRYPNLPLRVNADPVNIGTVKQMARTLHHRGHLKLLVVDYLQLMTGDKAGRSAEEEIARVSTELKNLAMELNIPVVVPAQLNRDSVKADRRPTKADLRGSGRIEQDADVVILLWRAPVVDPHTQESAPDKHYLTLIIDKNRHGQREDIKLRWNGGFGRVG